MLTGTEAKTQRSLRRFSWPTPAAAVQIWQDPLDRFGTPALNTKGRKRKEGHKSKQERAPPAGRTTNAQGVNRLPANGRVVKPTPTKVGNTKNTTRMK